MKKKIPLLLARLLPKLAGTAAASIILDKMLGGEDSFETNKFFPFLSPVRGTGGAEVVADQISGQLRSLGFKVKNYPQIATDARKAINSGKSLEDAVEEAFVKARDRADIIRDEGSSVAHPKIPGPHLEIEDKAKPGGKADAGDDDLDTPEAKKFMADLLKPGKPVDEIMLKKPEDLTEGEVKEIMIARMDAKTNDERERLFKAEKGFFDHFFGDEPVKPDAAGRTMEPKPIRPIPETPKPVLTAGGKPLDLDLKRIGRKIVRDAKNDGLATVVKRLQGGLNLLGEAKEPEAGFAGFSKLKEDGVPGPKTRTGLRRAVAN